MVSGKSKLYIYDRKEIAILVLLGVMVALFSFTLGIHLGKNVRHAGESALPQDPTTAPVIADKIPERAELAEQERKVRDTMDQSLYEELHREVGKTGVKLTPGRQVDLPENTITETPPSKASKTAGSDSRPEKLDDLLPALKRATPDGGVHDSGRVFSDIE